MKDYHVVAIILGTLIVLMVGLEWIAFQRSRQALQEGRCPHCGQVLPTKGGDE